MEPRRRNIEIVEFWKSDDQRRRVRLREAPDYPLERGAAVMAGDEVATAEDAQGGTRRAGRNRDDRRAQAVRRVGGESPGGRDPPSPPRWDPVGAPSTEMYGS